MGISELKQRAQSVIDHQSVVMSQNDAVTALELVRANERLRHKNKSQGQKILKLQERIAMVQSILRGQ